MGETPFFMFGVSIILLQMKNLCICLIFIPLSCFSQEEAINYHYFNDSNKKIIYFEDFNNPPDSTWFAEKDCFITDGYFHCRESKRYSAHDFVINIDTSKNFEIEIRAKAPRKFNDAGILFWGRKDSANWSNYWYFHNSAYSSIKHCRGWGNCDDQNVKGKIRMNEFNKYTVRKIGNTYHLYINEKQRKTLPATPFYGNSFGLGSGSPKRTAETVFDYIRISYLP